LPEELQAVLSKLEKPQRFPGDPFIFYQCNIGKAKVIVTRLDKAGNIKAAAAASLVLERYQPTYLLMVGIAAYAIGWLHFMEATYKSSPESNLTGLRDLSGLTAPASSKNLTGLRDLSGLTAPASSKNLTLPEDLSGLTAPASSLGPFIRKGHTYSNLLRAVLWVDRRDTER